MCILFLSPGDILVRVNDKFVLGYTLLEVSSLFESIELGELMKLEVCRGTTLMTDPSDLNTPNVTMKSNWHKKVFIFNLLYEDVIGNLNYRSLDHAFVISF